MHERSRILIYGALAISMGLATTGCSGSSGSATATTSGGSNTSSGSVPSAAATHKFSWGTFHLAPRIAQKLAKKQTINIVLQDQATSIPVFSAQQQAGLKKACSSVHTAAFSVNCKFTGPTTLNPTAQLGQLTSLRNSNQVDCLGLQAPTPDAFVGAVNAYVEGGIPVFTENTDVPDSKRFSFFALNDEQSGVAIGKEVATIVKAKHLAITKVALATAQPTEAWAHNRLKGFVSGYSSVLPNAQFYNSSTSALPVGADYTTKETLDATLPFLQANPSVGLIFDADQTVEGVGSAISRSGKSGKVWAAGYNVSAPILDDISSGITLATIDQGFDTQAEAVVKACVAFFTKGIVPTPLAYISPILVTKQGGSGLMTVAAAKQKLSNSGG